jgi:hypothetical protein
MEAAMNEWTPPPVRLPKLTKTELLDAIREGIADGLWRVATNATSMPCHDFYASIQDGVEAAVERVQRENPTTDPCR